MSVVRFMLRPLSYQGREKFFLDVLARKRISAPPEIRNPILLFISRRLLSVLTDVFQLVRQYYGIKQIIGFSMYWRL